MGHKFEPTQIFCHTATTILLTVFGHVVGEIPLQHCVEFIGCGTPVTALLGGMAQVVANAVGL